MKTNKNFENEMNNVKWYEWLTDYYQSPVNDQYAKVVTHTHTRAATQRYVCNTISFE